MYIQYVITFEGITRDYNILCMHAMCIHETELMQDVTLMYSIYTVRI